MLLTSISALKGKLGPVADEKSDEELSFVIDAASKMIEGHIGDISQKTITERVDSHGGNKIYVKNVVQSVVGVKKVDGQSIEHDFYDGYIIYLKKKLCKGNKSVLVKYTCGYTKPPTDLEEICLDICKNIFDEQNLDGGDESNIKTRKIGELSITYFGDREKSDTVKKLLSQSLNADKVFKKYRSFTGLHY